MKVSFDAQRIVDTFNADPEFRLCSRYWNGTLQFAVGDTAYAFTMVDGEIANVDVASVKSTTEDDANNGETYVRISGPHDDWAEFVKNPPPPFYQDYFSASAHYGFTLGGNPDLLWAYYPAIRRTGDLFRAIATVEGDQ